MDAGGGGAGDVVELSGLGVDVVFGVVAVQFFAADEVLEVDVAAGFGVAGFGVVIELIGAQQHVGGFQADGAAEVADGAFGVLGDGLDVNVVDVGSVRGEGREL